MSKHISALYSLLGVSDTASPAELKKAYYKLSQEHHPDTNPDADQNEMQKITRAYEVLTNKSKQQEYVEERKTEIKKSIKNVAKKKAVKARRDAKKRAKKNKKR